MAELMPQSSGDAIVMQEMLRGLNDLFHAYCQRPEAAAGHIPSSV
jgi:hypothetical protein